MPRGRTGPAAGRSADDRRSPWYVSPDAGHAAAGSSAGARCSSTAIRACWIGGCGCAATCARGRARTFDAGCGNGALQHLRGARRQRGAGRLLLRARAGGRASPRASSCGRGHRLSHARPARARPSTASRWATFDQIICFETIEHVSDDEGLVRLARGDARARGAAAADDAVRRAPSALHRGSSPERRRGRLCTCASATPQQRLREIAEAAGLRGDRRGLRQRRRLPEADRPDAPADASGSGARPRGRSCCRCARW